MKKRADKLSDFNPTIRIEVTGLNQPRLIFTLNKEGVPIKNITRKSSSVMNIDIAKKDSKKTFAIFENLCYTYSIVLVSGMNMMFRRAAARVGLIIGLVIFTALIALSRGFIWKLELSGLDNVSEQVVKNVLKSGNVEVGKRLKNIDKIALKNSINKTEGVLESTVEIVGTTVKITVIEATDFAPKPAEQSTDILSKYDAEITRIIALSGTCLVERGQKVFKDAPLIGAYRLNPEGEKAEIVSASGTVYGKVTITKSVTISTKEYILQPTGKTYNNSIYKIFGFTIGKNKNPYELYSSKIQTIYPFDGMFIPLKLEREELCEMERVLIEREVMDVAREKTAETVLENIIKCGGNEILTTTSLKPISDGLYTLNMFMQAEMPIN